MICITARGLDEQRKAAARAVEDYLIEHGSPSSDGAWTHYVYCVLTGGEHEQIYNSLGQENKAVTWHYTGKY